MTDYVKGFGSYTTSVRYNPCGGETGPQADRSLASKAFLTSTGFQLPAPTRSKVPTKLRTWLWRKLLALNWNLNSSPDQPSIRSILISSRVFIGLLAWHIDERNVVKSCLPSRYLDASTILDKSRECPICHTKPASWVDGARRTSSRNKYFRSKAEKRACQSLSTKAQSITATGSGLKWKFNAS